MGEDSHFREPLEPRIVDHVSVEEISVETRGALPKQRESTGVLSKVAMGVGVISLALAPVFGIGVIPAIVGIILGHIAKYGEPLYRIRAMVGLGLSYAGLVIGTAILVLVALPIVLAFLVSTGWVLDL